MGLDTAIKIELHRLCTEYVAERIDIAKVALADLKESMDEETKSSSGDKYETGRSMIQIDMERVMRQQSEAQKLKQAIESINPKLINKSVSLGSLVKTSNGYYYIAIAIGKMTYNETDFFIISPTSPIGLALEDKTVNDKIDFNGRSIVIEELL
jgi:transcription elongation GreA/GreB family factor